MRVAVRRIRSLLASGRPLFVDGAVEPVRSELRWLSGVLGAARDPGVVRDRLSALLAQEPAPLRLGPAAQRIDEELDALAVAGTDAAIRELRSERCAQLLDALGQLLAEAPLSPKAARKPAGRLRRMMAKDKHRLQRMVAALPPAADDDGGARDAGLHAVRKASKRLRFSAELAASRGVAGAADGHGASVGKKLRGQAKRTARAAHSTQKVLGRHQDSVVARARLAELGGTALRSGENGFSYGRLHAKEEALAAAAEREFLRLWKRRRP